MLERLKQTINSAISNLHSNYYKNRFYLFSFILGFIAILTLFSLFDASPE
jgi:hypothetical protein